MIRRLVLLAVLLAAAPASAQITPILQWDCGVGGASYPLCGAGAEGGSFEGVNWTRTYMGNIGPLGEAMVRITHLGDTDTAQEYYSGKWEWTAAAVPQGQCRYLREVLRLVAPIDWNDDAEGRFGLKHMVLGSDGTDDVNRGFVNLRSDLTVPADTHDPTNVLIRVEKNIDGAPSRTDIHDLTDANGFMYIQTEFCSSSTAVATNGSIKVWLSAVGAGQVYASPTAQSSGGFAWPTVGWTRIAWGFYGESLGVGHTATYDMGAFTYDDEFDPNWGVGTPAPAGKRPRFTKRAALEPTAGAVEAVVAEASR